MNFEELLRESELVAEELAKVKSLLDDYGDFRECCSGNADRVESELWDAVRVLLDVVVQC